MDLYEAISRRRDVRREFTGAAIPAEVLTRLLTAAHAAPSVGLTQPWDFIVIEDLDVRRQFQAHVAGEREVFAALDAEGFQTLEEPAFEVGGLAGLEGDRCVA